MFPSVIGGVGLSPDILPVWSILHIRKLRDNYYPIHTPTYI
jgi:hypothetical protein